MALPYVIEKYPKNSTEFVGAVVSTEDGSPINVAILKITVLAHDVVSPPNTTTWYDPGMVEEIDAAHIIVKILRGPTGGVIDPSAGKYRVWVRITDSPEDAWIASPQIFEVV